MRRWRDVPDIPSSITRIVEEHAAQERVWLASRIAWAGMALVLALAVAGLFGDGPLSHRRTAASDGSLAVEYEGFQRRNATTAIVLQAAARDTNGAVRICLEHGFTADWRLVRMRPSAVREVATSGGLCLHFAVEAGPGPPPPVTISVQPRAMSFATSGSLRANGGAPVALRVLVWP